MYSEPYERQQRLGWHETMEIHELVAFQSVGLMKLKRTYSDIRDPVLKSLYKQTIGSMSKNINELLRFYPMAPHPQREERALPDDLAFYSGDLLALAKTSVRNYAIAITETATPSLRNVLTRQLLGAIETHAKVYKYMYERGFYPSYDLNRLLQNDMNLAKKALSFPY
ncbi:spore coat protein [Terrilactibacillus sp. BCM23-1]|uniref:Spore coat protein n=1 Tax=Terrilactibacillus tamarindi TaxID=2599694 RepID=A0A6N8CS78_9BACI|nr:spore coat protein [Terrilactibacillus tamarindi]MTT33069.1 spore coat protein [Terrilactibacillus tamarindi]